MNSVPLHPSIVHVPIALAVLLPLISAGLLILWWRGWLPRRAWWLTVALQAILVAGAVLAMRTGEGDEERVERFVGESLIEQHEQAAELFLWGSVIVLVVALVAALLPRARLALSAAAASTLGTLVVLGLGFRVGQAGGELVYRHGAAAAFTAPGPGAVTHRKPAALGEAEAEMEDHDDD